MQIDYKNVRVFLKEFKEESKNYNYENLAIIIDWMDNYARLMEYEHE